MHEKSLSALEEALDSEDTDTLQEVGHELLSRIESLEAQLQAFKSTPGQKYDLARAVCNFAEWQTTCYTEDVQTRLEVGGALWDEVARNVHAITGFYPEAVGAHAPTLAAAGKGRDVGVSSPSPVREPRPVC